MPLLAGTILKSIYSDAPYYMYVKTPIHIPAISVNLSMKPTLNRWMFKKIITFQETMHF